MVESIFLDLWKATCKEQKRDDAQKSDAPLGHQKVDDFHHFVNEWVKCLTAMDKGQKPFAGDSRSGLPFDIQGQSRMATVGEDGSGYCDGLVKS